VIKKRRKTRRLKPATGLWKIQPQWVVTPRKQTNNKRAFKYTWDFASPYYEGIQSSNGAVADIGDTAKIYKRFREVCVTRGSDFKDGASDSST
jgi:hypothetical protein